MRLFLLLSLLVTFSWVGCRTNETPEAQVNDLEITTQLKSKLAAADVGLSTMTNISVNFTNGVVTLAGSVDSADAKAKAEALARAIPKEVRVVNNLQIVSKVFKSKKVADTCCGQSS
jgi:osmotically-inducible protein OsmY